MARFWDYVKRTGAMPTRRTPLKDRLFVTGLCTFSILMLAPVLAYAQIFIVLFIRALF